VRKAGLKDLNELSQIIMASTRELTDAYFESPELKALFATWGMHLDFGPDVSGGTMFPLLSTFNIAKTGISLAKGGGERMVEALAGLLREHGGEIRTEAEVTQVLTAGGRATGVRLASGEEIPAERAVIANLTPTVLYDLLDPDALPSSYRRKVKDYLYGPGTMMIHVALSGRLPWKAGEELADFTYVHIPPYVEDLARTYTQAMNGYLPDDPLLIVGQPVPTDPSRVPEEGQQILWIQVRALPSPIKGDAAGKIDGRDWDSVGEAYADRVMAKIEAYAPGASDLVLERAVFSPAYLERHNPNLVGGDSIAGSHHLRQNFLWRPFPNWSTYETPLEGLWEVGAGTWPGAGTNATSGYLAAQSILHPHATRNKLIGGGLAVGGAAAGVALLAHFLSGDDGI
jgi:phytoene dehydrogenase-like protein